MILLPNTDKLKFEVMKLDFETMGEALQRFYKQCKDSGLSNNISAKNMKVDQFHQQSWWGVFTGNQLISVSGCYQTNDFGPSQWRLLFRSATLPQYRTQAGRFSRDLNHDFCWGVILPLQKAFARSQGGQTLFFTTNAAEDGYAGSLKVNQFVEKVLLPMNKVRLLHGPIRYYSCMQNIWEIL